MDAPFPEGMVEAIEDILKQEPGIPNGQDVYPHIFESALFMPLQRKYEMQQMVQLARSVPHATVMEVGADKGGSVYTWVKALQPKRMIACEIRGTPYAQAFDRTFPLTDFCWTDGSSFDPGVVGRIQSWLRGHTIDILFLDGDKFSFARDFEAYVSMMTPGGYVFMHDIVPDLDPHPRRAFTWASERPQVAQALEIIDFTEHHQLTQADAQGPIVGGPYNDWLRYWGPHSCGVGVLHIRQ
jgi:predicted O-methyltransferase YrrM